MRLIDADALDFGCLLDGICEGQAYEVVGNAPTIDQRKICEECQLDDCIALTRKHGKWERPVVNGLTCLTALCSVCGYVNNNNDGFKFCPNCGADMRGE